MAFASVIKYEGDNKTFVYKFPDEDFNSNSQLIVHETQEAVFFSNGKALDLFGPGKYTLETQNIPIIGKLLNIATGGVSQFHCEVYFINKTEQMAIKWGTDSKVQYIEPRYGFPISIGASGELSLKISDSRKLLVKIVGTESELSQEKLVSMLKAMLLVKVKPYIAKNMRESAINIFEIDERLEEFSNGIKTMLAKDFDEYGIELTKFLITNFVTPEDDLTYKKFKDLHFRQYADVAEAKLRQNVEVINQETEAKKMQIESEALANKRKTEGYTYQQERGFDVAQDIARNEAKGSMMNMGIGLGSAVGVGGMMGGMLGNLTKDTVDSITNKVNDVTSSKKNICPNCNLENPTNAKFCNNCGTLLNQSFKCPNCNTEYTPGSKFCNNCGQKLI